MFSWSLLRTFFSPVYSHAGRLRRSCNPSTTHSILSEGEMRTIIIISLARLHICSVLESVNRLQILGVVVVVVFVRHRCLHDFSN